MIHASLIFKSFIAFQKPRFRLGEVDTLHSTTITLHIGSVIANLPRCKYLFSEKEFEHPDHQVAMDSFLSICEGKSFSRSLSHLLLVNSFFLKFSFFAP